MAISANVLKDILRQQQEQFERAQTQLMNSPTQYFQRQLNTATNVIVKNSDTEADQIAATISQVLRENSSQRTSITASFFIAGLQSPNAYLHSDTVVV